MGIGSVFAPILGAGFYYLGGYTLAFAYLAVCYVIVSPFVKWRLTKAQELWNKLQEEQAALPRENLITLDGPAEEDD